jgi:hypothetical protein
MGLILILLYIMATEVHALMFNNKKFTTYNARKWLKKNNYVPRKRVMKTENYLRYNITPKKKNVIYRTIFFGDDILAVIEIQKGGKASTRIQAIIFEKKFFTIPQAKRWLKKHSKKYIKYDITSNFYRFRIIEPKKNGIYRMINFGDNIKAVLEITKPRKDY